MTSPYQNSVDLVVREGRLDDLRAANYAITSLNSMPEFQALMQVATSERNLTISLEGYLFGGSAYLPDTNTIFLDPVEIGSGYYSGPDGGLYPLSLQEVLIHELVHAVQEVPGWQDELAAAGLDISQINGQVLPLTPSFESQAIAITNHFREMFGLPAREDYFGGTIVQPLQDNYRVLDSVFIDMDGDGLVDFINIDEIPDSFLDNNLPGFFFGTEHMIALGYGDRFEDLPPDFQEGFRFGSLTPFLGAQGSASSPYRENSFADAVTDIVTAPFQIVAGVFHALERALAAIFGPGDTVPGPLTQAEFSQLSDAERQDYLQKEAEERAQRRKEWSESNRDERRREAEARAREEQAEVDEWSNAPDYDGVGFRSRIAAVSGSDGPNLNLVSNDIYGAEGDERDNVISASGASRSVSISGSAGNDILTGGDHADFLIGGSGADQIRGGAGDDTLGVDASDTEIQGGSGYDTIIGMGSVGLNVGLHAASVEEAHGTGERDIFNGLGSYRALSVTGGGGNDTIYGGYMEDNLEGNAGGDVLRGDRGSDVISGGLGDDVIAGGVGGDLLHGDSGNDAVNGEEGDDFIFAGDGLDDLRGDVGDDYLDGGAGNDLIKGGTGDDSIFGQSGADNINGESGDDSIDAGSGNDVIRTGSGDDSVKGGDGDDTIYIQSYGDKNVHAGAGDDEIIISAAYATQQHVKGGIGNDTVVLSGVQADYTIEYLRQGSNYPHAINEYVVYKQGEIALYVQDVEQLEFTGGGSYSFTNSDVAEDNSATFVLSTGRIELTGAVAGSFPILHWSDGGDIVSSDYYSTDASGVTRDLGAGADTYTFAGGADDVQLGSGADNVQVFEGDDIVDGWSGADTIDGGAGDDVISGDGGADTVSGGSGNDTIQGGSGADELLGGDGNDTIHAASGSDTVQGGAGVDLIYGEGGGDFLFGGDGNDTVYGGDDGDVVNGGLGQDLLYGGDGGDRMYGDTGNDVIHGQYGNDTMNGDDGNDVLYGHRGSDKLYGGNGDDILRGHWDNDYIEGGDGWDRIFGGDDNDHLLGGAGDDELYGEMHNDIIEGGAGADIIDGGHGSGDAASYEHSTAGVHVNLKLNSANFGDAQGDSLTGIEQLIGSKHDDVLRGAATDSRLNGRRGDDALYGYEGSDILDGGSDNDHLEGRGGADDLFGGSGDDTLLGGAGNDYLFGGEGADIFDGGDGDDVIHYELADLQLDGGVARDMGGAGYDTLVVEQGSYFDTSGLSWYGFEALIGAENDDRAVGNDASVDYYMSGGAGNDDFTGNDGEDTLIGGAGDDVLAGGAGADTINGGAGNDILRGSSGADTFVFGTGHGNDQIETWQDNFDKIQVDWTDGVMPTNADFMTTVTKSYGVHITFESGDVIKIMNWTGNTFSASDITISDFEFV